MRVWVCPAELDQPIPRRVGLRWQAIAAVLLGLTLGGLAPGLVVIVTWQVAHDQMLLQQRGVQATAEVIGHGTRSGKGGRSYHITYRFVPSGSDPAVDSRTGTGSVAASVYDRIEIGDLVPILYDPLNPGRSDLNVDDALRRADPFGALTFAGIIVLVYVFMVPPLLSRPLDIYRRDRDLLRNGAAAEARNLSVRMPVRVLPKGQPSIGPVVTFDFTDRTGATIQGEHSYPPAAPDRLLPGTRLLWARAQENPTVLYDPAKPSRAIIYPSLWLRCLRG